MLKYTMLAAALLLGGLTGCISVKYSGETFEPTTDVKLYDNIKNVPFKPAVIGRCVAYGQYDRFTKEDICKDVRAKAEAVGAQAVYIYAYQVIPESEVTGQLAVIWNDYTSDAEWGKLEQDFASYGEIGRDSSGSSRPTGHYVRVIRAEFLRDASSVPPAKATVEAPIKANRKNARIAIEPDSAALKGTAPEKPAAEEKVKTPEQK